MHDENEFDLTSSHTFRFWTSSRFHIPKKIETLTVYNVQGQKARYPNIPVIESDFN